MHVCDIFAQTWKPIWRERGGGDSPWGRANCLIFQLYFIFFFGFVASFNTSCMGNIEFKEILSRFISRFNSHIAFQTHKLNAISLRNMSSKRTTLIVSFLWPILSPYLQFLGWFSNIYAKQKKKTILLLQLPFAVQNPGSLCVYGYLRNAILHTEWWLVK